MRLLFAALLVCSAAAAADHPPNHELLDAALWTQTAAEHDAAYLAAYNTAREQLNRALKDKHWTAALEQTGKFGKLPPAIILDIDETVVDNSPMEARLIFQDAEWTPAAWGAWTAEAAAGALPGAVEFTKYARSRGVTVFFVTNRDAREEQATRRNLASLGFPLDAARGPLTDTVMSLHEKPDWGSDKASRRTEIAAHYRVLLLVGDDLGDFLPNVRMTVEARRALTTTYAGYWGLRWIMLPNPMYGSWESAVFGNDMRQSRAQRLERKFGTLETAGRGATAAAAAVAQ